MFYFLRLSCAPLPGPNTARCGSSKSQRFGATGSAHPPSTTQVQALPCHGASLFPRLSALPGTKASSLVSRSVAGAVHGPPGCARRTGSPQGGKEKEYPKWVKTSLNGPIFRTFQGFFGVVSLSPQKSFSVIDTCCVLTVTRAEMTSEMGPIWQGLLEHSCISQVWLSFLSSLRSCSTHQSPDVF